MGKQVNFFLRQEDFSTIDAFLKEHNYIIIDSYAPTKDIAFLSFVNEKGYHVSWKKYITKLDFLDKIQNKRIEKRQIYTINELYSPVVEIILSTENIEKNELSTGRLYYQTGFYDENGVWQEKDAEFLKAAEKLFRWFRKNFQKSELALGFYTSPAVLAWVKNGGVLKQV